MISEERFRKACTRRDVPCVVCASPVAIRSVTTTDPECPELICPAYASTSLAWFLFIAGDAGGVEFGAVCSDRCARVLTTDAEARATATADVRWLADPNEPPIQVPSYALRLHNEAIAVAAALRALVIAGFDPNLRRLADRLEAVAAGREP